MVLNRWGSKCAVQVSMPDAGSEGVADTHRHNNTKERTRVCLHVRGKIEFFHTK